MLSLAQRIDLLSRLGDYIMEFDESVEGLIEYAYLRNKWFTHDNTRRALTAIATGFLGKKSLEALASKYTISDSQQKSIGLILAGNIPAVGFHDILCCFLAGHKSVIKPSDKDAFLMPFLVKQLVAYDATADEYFNFVERLKDIDAVIATGSNSSSIYFKKYFGKYPHIIRANRNGVAILDGTETGEQLKALNDDIFHYFGMGCRNVSKIYVPEGYNFDPLLESSHERKDIINHNKYKNNFDYNMAILVLNKETFYNNGCLILKEDKQIPSRISTLHYEYYSDINKLQEQLQADADEIQCICTDMKLDMVTTVPLGGSQTPRIDQFADDVDTMKFLTAL